MFEIFIEFSDIHTYTVYSKKFLKKKKQSWFPVTQMAMAVTIKWNLWLSLKL
jgi:hypothetical protein